MSPLVTDQIIITHMSSCARLRLEASSGILYLPPSLLTVGAGLENNRYDFLINETCTKKKLKWKRQVLNRYHSLVPGCPCHLVRGYEIGRLANRDAVRLSCVLHSLYKVVYNDNIFQVQYEM